MSDTETYQQPDVQETERFLTKIWQPKKHNENAEWINNITREVEGLEEGPQTEIHIDLLKTTLKRGCPRGVMVKALVYEIVAR